MSHFDLWLSTCAHWICWNSLAETQRWQEEMSQLTYSHSSDTAAVCPLLSNKGPWNERLSWFESVRDIWWCWYGSLRYVHVVDNVFVSLSPRVLVCMCVCVCITVQECFPICFLCVFDRDERALCSHVCWQEVRHSCTRPQLVSVRILCSFASTHFCSVFFSFFAFFFCSFQSLGIEGVCFYFICLSLHLHHLSPLAYALPPPWLVLWQWRNCAYSPLTVSRLIQPPCQSCTRLPKEDVRPCSPLI